MSWRERIALWICPALDEIVSKTKSGAVPPGKPEWRLLANDVRLLDRTYSTQTGVLLSASNAPRDYAVAAAYEHRERAVAAILRARYNAYCGVQPKTHRYVLEYLSAVWPEGAPWPLSIPRPTPTKSAQDVAP